MTLSAPMRRKDHIDTFGATILIVFAAVLAFNQVVIKVTNGGFQPVFQAGLRSLLAAILLMSWMRLRGIGFPLDRGIALGGVLSGGLFAFEFVCLFIALDLTTVSRASIMFYSMPIWLAGAAHLFLPGERLTGRRLLGFALAMGGVVLALADGMGGAGSLTGDLLALVGALAWAGIALTVRLTGLSRARPEVQLLWQLIVSAPLLLITALFFGDLLRDPQLVHYAGLAFQVLFVAVGAFLLWFWLLTIYPASGVASFSFLSPVLAVLLGWFLLGEDIGPALLVALGLVAFGLILINRR